MPNPVRRSPRPIPFPRLSLACLATLVLASAMAIGVSGCASGRSVSVQHSNGSQWVRNGDEWKIRVVDPTDESILTAELKIEREESNGIATYRLERIELFPPGDPMPRLWRLLPPRSKLLARDGSTLEHPDAARLTSLGSEPSLDAALATLPELLHYDSRGEALARVARGPDGERAFDRLVEILALGGAGPIGDPASDDLSAPLGGSSRRAAAPGLEVLSTRSDLSAAQSGALAPLVDRIPTGERRRKYLERLVGKTTVSAIAAAIPKLPTNSERAAVAERLAQQPDLTDAEVVEICRATTEISSPSRQTAVLLHLVPRGPIGPILDAVSHIQSSSGRTEVLLALSSRRPLSTPDATAIAHDSKSIGSSSGQTRVLENLVDVAPLADLLSAAQMIQTSSGRSAVFTTLARRPGLPREEAGQIALASFCIQSSSGQAEVLEELIGIAPTTSVLTGALAVRSTAGRSEIFERLALQQNLSPADANAIASASPLLESPSGQTRVLRALIGTASLPKILGAIPDISSVSGRGEVLMNLAESPELDREGADAIARTVECIRASGSTSRQVLRELVGIASTSEILQISTQISSESQRFEVLIALARQLELSPEDAALIAATAGELSTSKRIDELVRALIGRAPAEALRAAAAQMSTKSRRESLIEQIDRATPAEERGD